MNTSEKYTLASEVIDHALKNGAQQASVSINENTSCNIEIRDQKIDNLVQSSSNGLNLSLYVDNRYSSHNTNRLNQAELHHFIEEAITATKYLAEDKFRSLPDADLYYKGGGADLNTFDKSVESFETRSKIDLAKQVLDEAYQKDERIISVSSYYSDNISRGILVTSNGFKGDYAYTGVSLYATVSVKSDKGRPSDYWFETSNFFDKLKKTGIGERALARTIKKIGPEKVASGKYTMIVENRVAPNILSAVYSSLQGSSIYNKQSFLSGKSGKPVASPVLDISDDPLITGASGSRLFDEEGLKSVKRPVIENGILRNFYINTYYGKKLGIAPTTGSKSNAIFRLGKKGLDDLVKSTKKGILVTGFNGGNFNGTTGDFSYGIEGFFIENGTITHPVSEMNISGNMNQVLFNLVEVGNDIIEGLSDQIPSLMFDSIDFSGI